MNSTLEKLKRHNITPNIASLIQKDIQEGMQELERENKELIMKCAKLGFTKEIKIIQKQTKNLKEQNELMNKLLNENVIIG